MEIYGILAIIVLVCSYQCIDACPSDWQVNQGNNGRHDVLKNALVSNGVLQCFFESFRKAFVPLRWNEVARRVGEVVVEIR